MSGKDNCKQLPNDTTLQSKNLLSKKTGKGLKIFNPNTPKFYIAPKIHKKKKKKKNLGRPVLNSINCHTSEISHFVDYYLQPVVKEIPSYIIDTNDFVKKVPKDSILVTMDVKSLHTRIPHHEGIAAVKKRYDKCANKTISTKIITAF